MDRILGCDISYHQGDVDFEKMKAAGAEFVIIRKQIGYYGDLRFFKNFEGAKAAGLKVGIYGVPFIGYSIPRQFAKLTEGIQPSDLDFPPFADIERRHRNTKSVAIGDVLDYLQRIVSWYGDAVIYTAKFVWEGLYSNKKGWINDWDLFVANYYNGDQPYYIPVGWTHRLDGTPVAKNDSYVIWQNSADKNGRGYEFGVSSADIDLDWMQQRFWDKHINTSPEPDWHKLAVHRKAALMSVKELIDTHLKWEESIWEGLESG